jgi:hypothetical protein
MSRSGLTIAVLTALLLATSAAAGPKDKDHKGKGHQTAQHCPPGLAKKTPACIPPGQAGKRGGIVVIQPETVVIRPGTPAIDRIVEEDVYAIGVPLPDRFVVLFDPQSYPQWPRASYARLDDYIYLIDPDSRRILALPEPLGNWIWNWADVDFRNCPPGLAKKNPPCVPPGQAMEEAGPYLPGDVLPPGHQLLFAPIGDSNDDDGLYARLGDSIYRIDRDTGAVLQLIGTVASLLG